MSDMIKSVVNSVNLVGTIVEFEYKTGETKEEKIPYVSLKGAIQFGDSKAQTRRFERYVQQRSKAKDGKEGKENKLYDKTLSFANPESQIYDNLIECVCSIPELYDEIVKLKVELEEYEAAMGNTLTYVPPCKDKQVFIMCEKMYGVEEHRNYCIGKHCPQWY